MEPTPTPENGRQSPGPTRFWPVHGVPVPVQRESDEDNPWPDEPPAAPPGLPVFGGPAGTVRRPWASGFGEADAAPGGPPDQPEGDVPDRTDPPARIREPQVHDLPSASAASDIRQSVDARPPAPGRTGADLLGGFGSPRVDRHRALTGDTEMVALGSRRTGEPRPDTGTADTGPAPADATTTRDAGTEATGTGPARTEATAAGTARTEAAGTETARTETARTEAARTEAARTETGRTEAVRTETARTETAGTGPVAAQMRPGDVELTRVTFWDDAATRQFHADWHELKAQFVDDPVTALTRAHALLTEAVQELTESLLAERDELDPLRRSSNPDTESMRMAMRDYQEFLDRILTL